MREGTGAMRSSADELLECQSGRTREPQRHLLEAEDHIGPPAMTVLTFVFQRNVIRTGGAVDVATLGERGIRLVRVPGVGCRSPDSRALVPESRFDPLAGDAELLPELGADGELPLVAITRVDLRARRQLDPAALVRAVGPELDRPERTRARQPRAAWSKCPRRVRYTPALEAERLHPRNADSAGLGGAASLASGSPSTTMPPQADVNPMNPRTPRHMPVLSLAGT